MRCRPLALLLLPLTSLTAAVPAHAANIFLKVKADGAAGQPVRVTVKALSRVPVTLPAEPIVYVDEGQGWKARPDLSCRLADTTLRLEADREYSGTCELALPASRPLRFRLGYRHGESVSTSNSVNVQSAGTAQAAK
jgi:hypothetical protein